MLLIPFDRRIDWSHPPVVTLALILANVLLYFGWQQGEERAMADAAQYYQESGLAKREIPLYQDYLRETGRAAEADRDQGPTAWFGDILMDYGFRQRIDAGTVLPVDATDYRDWRQKRRRLDDKLHRVTYLEYGLKTGDPDLASLFAHMFLHGGVAHLLGNMFFLFAVGFLVERTIGAWVFLTCYLLGGLGSAGFDILLDPDQLVPGIGASGAIAGLMGLYTVLYWTRPVRFFYFLLVYFDYVRLPALALLPLWIANELFQIWAYPNSGVNYLAHLGGLVSGAAIGLVVRHTLPSFSLEHLDRQDRQQAFRETLDQAAGYCRDLDFQRAKPLLQRLSHQQPADAEVLSLLRDCLRVDPSTEEYHRVSAEILTLQPSDPQDRRRVVETFIDYSRHARPKPRLNQAVLCRLAPMLIEQGRSDDGRALFRTLLKHRWPCPDAELTLQRLVRELEQRGQPDEADRYRTLLTDLQRGGR